MTREELSTRKQRLREESSSLHKKCEVMIKIADREEIKKMQKKIIEQILQKIADVSTSQQNLIMSLCKHCNSTVSQKLVKATMRKIQKMHCRCSCHFNTKIASVQQDDKDVK